MRSVLKFVDFASFICIFGHIITIEKQANLETLYSWVCALCDSRKYPYLPHGWSVEIPRGWGVQKVEIFEEYRGCPRE